MATTCTNSLIARVVEFFSLAFTVTLIYLALQLPPVEQWFSYYIPDETYRFITKALLFFTLTYIVDRILVYLRNDIDLCEFPLF